MLRIHVLAVGFLIPPHIAKITVHHIGARMNVTGDALARRHGARESMRDWMARLILRYRWIGISAQTLIAVLCIRTRIHSGAIIGINNMARTATTGAVVAGMIVSAEKVGSRIEQARALQADEGRIGAILGAEA